MTEAAQSYVPQQLAIRFRAQAWKVWASGLVIITLWLTLIVTAPLARASGIVAVSSPIYHFFSFLCHQISDRSLHIEGEQLAVCSRCFGVYSGLLAGFAAYPVWRGIDNIDPLPRVWLFLSLIPIAVDWSLTFFGIWENTHGSRFATGAILGAACGTFIAPSIVEITRNFTYWKLAKRPRPA
jgi:uncharacterized membrane protein